MRIIKLGGSLLTNHNVLLTLCNFFQYWEGIGLCLVPGGGLYSREVKKHQKKSNLTETEAHWMAIKATEILGVLLSLMIPKASLVDKPRMTPNGHIDIFLPFKYFIMHDPIPHSWDATSDSITAHVGEQLGVTDFIKITAGDDKPEVSLDSVTKDKIIQEKVKWDIISTQQSTYLNDLKQLLNQN